MRIFLTMKHWQLFVLFIGLPLFLEILMIVLVVATADTRILFYVFPVMMILCVGSLFGWLYSLGTSLYKRLPENAAMSLTRFKIFFFIPVGYILSLLVFMFWAYKNAALVGQPHAWIFLLIFPLHLFAMFCIFYCLYFIAKALKAVEWQRPVTFSDYVGEFFLLWFHFVGVWFIQPRINKLFDPAPGS